MAITVSFTNPTPNLAVRSVYNFPYTGLILMPTWDRHAMYTYNPTTQVVNQTSTAITDSNPVTTAATGNGYISGAYDSSSDIYLLTNDSRLDCRVSGVFHIYACAPGGKIPVQIAWTGTQGIVETADGEVYGISNMAAGGTLTYTAIATFPAYASDMQFYNGFAYGTVASTSQLSKIAISGGTVTNVSTPMVKPIASAPASFGDAVIGYSNPTISNSYFELLPLPTNTSVIAGLRAGAATIDLLTGNDAGLSVTSSVSASSQPTDAAWQTNGEQLLAVESSGSVQVFAYSSGSLTSSQVLTVSGAQNLSLSQDNTQALVSRPGSNQITVLNNTLNTWSVGATITGVTAPGPITTLSSTKMAVSVTNGVAILSEVAAVWTVSTTITTPFTPSSLFYDPVTSNLYVCGSAAGIGYLGYIDNSFAYHAGASWTGNATSVKVIGNRVVVLDTTNNKIYTFPSGSQNYAAEIVTTSLPVTSTLYLAITEQNLWLATSSLSYSMNFFGANGAPVRNRLGMVSVYNETASSWVSHSFVAEVIPTAATWDTAGNLWVVTSDNNLYQFTAGLSITSTTALGEYAGQAAGVTLGVSNICYYNGSLYMTTSLSGVIIAVTGF